jgi:hypothetical protein
MSGPSFKTEADNAGKYPSQRFGQRERKLLETIQAAFPFGAVFAGEHTTVGGAAAEAISIPGLLATDIALCTLAVAGAVPRTILTSATTADTLTVTFSGDPAGDHVVSYVVFRAQA